MPQPNVNPGIGNKVMSKKQRKAAEAKAKDDAATKKEQNSNDENLSLLHLSMALNPCGMF